MAQIDDALNSLSGPQKVETDQTSFEMPKLCDLIKAHAYLASIAGVNQRKTRGLRFNRLILPSQFNTGALSSDQFIDPFGGF